MRFTAAIIACGILAAPTSVQASPPFKAAVASAKAAMLADPDRALAEARRASGVAATLADLRARALAEAEAAWLQGEALTRINRVEDARPFIAAARTAVVRYAPGTKLHGDLLITSGAIEGMTGRAQQALTDLQAAHKIFVAIGDARSQAMALQDMGNIYADARDYPRMFRYYAQSAEVYGGDPNISISAYNNQASAMEELGRYPEAVAFYGRALAIARDLDSAVLTTRILTNLAGAYVQSGDIARANVALERGFAAAAGRDTGWESFLWGVKGEIAVARNRPEEARAAFERAFAGQDLAQTDPQFREFHLTASRLYEAGGDPAKALVHLAAFKRLDDEMREIAISTNASLMTARFDFASQELSIAKLKAGQLQRDVALERSKARLSKITLYGLIAALAVAALVLAGALWSLVSIRRSRNKLGVANAELETALAAKTRFLATTSHEIRTPLNGILGMTQVMLQDRELGDTHRDRIRIVHDAGETMKALVDDILDVAKIENGTVVIDRAEVPLRAVLEGVARTWTDGAAAKGLSLDIDVAAAPARVLGDERRLRQIVFNLLSNAIKFTEHGGVTLAATADGDTLVLSVSDTGIGIPADQLQAVFASFHQVDGETTRRYGGTGLGLSICDDLVRAMGGTIALESELGVGSTFTVRLPIELPATPAAATCDEGWPDSLAGARVLVVEDNPLARSVIAAALKPQVCDVVAVGSGDACGLFAQPFHHAVLDCAALAQIENAERLIQSLAAQGLVTLLAGADVDPQLTAAHARAGAGQLLKRPIAPAALLDALRQAHAARTHTGSAIAKDAA